MTGLFVVGAALVLVLAFAAHRLRSDGRVRAVVGAADRLDAKEIDAKLGQRATLVQFSSRICGPCRAVRRTLAGLAEVRDDVVHAEIDVDERLELARRFDVTRTPTVLILDGAGVVRGRIVGPARERDLVEAFTSLVPA